MKILSFLVIISCLGVLSCKSLNTTIQKNKNKTVELFDAVFKNNGNAFSTGSTYTNFSYVWSYQDDKTILYKLVEGKVVDEKEFREGNKEWLSDVPHKSEMVFMECYELDGDYIKYKIYDENDTFEDVLPVNLNCFLNIPKDKVFYKNLTEDIKKYGAIW